MVKSEIQNFFKDQTIFITGGTGFLGKILVEKLLYSCQVRKIYILSRAKKGKTVQERRQSYFNVACFRRLEEKILDLANIVSFIKGDLSEAKLGLSEEDERNLINETSVVIHAAANVKFDQPLQEAYNINVRGTSDVLDLAKKMEGLKSFVYVSTAYSHCPHSRIEEKFYQSPITSSRLAKIIEGLNEELLAEITPKLICPWPNTYVYTKAIAEDLVQKEFNTLPLAIIRPSIIISTAAEPFPGWIDNFYGPIGITVAGGMGVLRTMHLKLELMTDLVPADYVVNAILAIASKFDQEKNISRIYNYVNWNNKITWNFYMQSLNKVGWNYPSLKMLWYPSPASNVHENLLWHKICVVMYHNIPAYIIDIVLTLIGRKPLAVENYKRINKSIELVSYFSTRQWTFDFGNTERLWNTLNDFDKKLFDFDMDNLDRLKYAEDCIKGGRVHLLKDPLETLPESRKKLFKLQIAHYCLLALVYFLIFMFVRMVIGCFISV